MGHITNYYLDDDDLWGRMIIKEDLFEGRGYRAEKFESALDVLLKNYHSLSTEEIDYITEIAKRY